MERMATPQRPELSSGINNFYVTWTRLWLLSNAQLRLSRISSPLTFEDETPMRVGQLHFAEAPPSRVELAQDHGRRQRRAPRRPTPRGIATAIQPDTCRLGIEVRLERSCRLTTFVKDEQSARNLGVGHSSPEGDSRAKTRETDRGCWLGIAAGVRSGLGWTAQSDGQRPVR